jgi:hypothetical protein
MDDATLSRMNWFVQGVIGSLPKPQTAGGTLGG